LQWLRRLLFGLPGQRNQNGTNMNISGVLVRTYPEQIESVGKILSAMAGVEVHGNNEDGRIVVTVEQDDANQMTDVLIGMQTIPGVLAASMIYHQFED
jgi:nitrate reductase NapD